MVLPGAAGIGEREGTENLVNSKKESGEDYARRILEVLETAREEKRRKKKEEDNVTKWNVSAGVFYPAREKAETEMCQLASLYNCLDVCMYVLCVTLMNNE